MLRCLGARLDISPLLDISRCISVSLSISFNILQWQRSIDSSRLDMARGSLSTSINILEYLATSRSIFSCIFSYYFTSFNISENLSQILRCWLGAIAQCVFAYFPTVLPSFKISFLSLHIFQRLTIFRAARRAARRAAWRAARRGTRRGAASALQSVLTSPYFAISLDISEYSSMFNTYRYLSTCVDIFPYRSAAWHNTETFRCFEFLSKSPLVSAHICQCLRVSLCARTRRAARHAVRRALRVAARGAAHSAARGTALNSAAISQYFFISVYVSQYLWKSSSYY